MTDLESTWGKEYRDFTSRNIGAIPASGQERLRTSKVSVFGVGGIGGSVFEILVRCGIGRFSIVDRDVFDASNMNRQVFAHKSTLGKMKIDVAAEWAKDISSDVEVETFDHIDEDNVGDILRDADVCVMGIDNLAPCVIGSRKARELNIPLVEGWAIPYGNVRVFTQDTPTLEEAYGLPTKGRAVSDITDEEFAKFGLALILNLGRIEGIPDFYPEEAVEKIRNGQIVSFAPIVRMTAVMLALETTKVLLDWGKIAFADPDFTMYDPFHHRIPRMTE